MRRVCSFIDPVTNRGCSRPGDARFRNRCAAHRQTTSERGYGRGHQEDRAEMARHLPLPCAYCTEPITSNHELAAAHEVDGDHASRRLPAHRRCNERAKHGLAVLHG